MALHAEKLTITTSSGRGKSAINPVLRGDLKQILVSPASANTTYELEIENAEGLIIYKTTGRIGAIAPIVEVPILKTSKRIVISGASNDEDFTIQLIVDKRLY